MKRNILLTSFLFLVLLLVLIQTSCAPYFENPPTNLQKSDLVGVWETKYGNGRIDRIIIRDDDTFKQIYSDDNTNYTFETPWNKWWLEKTSEGMVRIHLTGGRYYVSGIEKAERNGLLSECPPDLPDCNWDHLPYLFHDPYADESILMVGELVMNVRVDLFKELVLHHMGVSSEGGFAIIGGEQDIFRRKQDNE